MHRPLHVPAEVAALWRRQKKKKKEIKDEEEEEEEDAAEQQQQTCVSSCVWALGRVCVYEDRYVLIT